MTGSLALVLVILIGFSNAKKVKDNDDKLIAVALMFRHGDRTIITTYPNDPYKDLKYWPEGFGQLTNRGVERIKTFGKWFKRKYEEILPTNFGEMYFQSTNSDRTRNSSKYFISELYDDEKWQNVIKVLPWQENYYLKWNKTCNKYIEAKTRYIKYLINNLPEDFDGIFDYCTEKTGKKAVDLLYFENLHGVLENEEEERNLTLPDWTGKIYPNKTQYLSFLSFSSHSGLPILAKLANGPLFDLIINNFENNTYKLMAFACHDTQISNILKTFNSFHDIPKYAASIIFELHQTKSMGKYINILYKEDDNIRPIILENCTKNCDLKQFKEVLKPFTLTPEQWNQECTN
ncbi:unnamed protein product [Brassicogethes aeneus]|uniref:acid phosphatase n=1 Tax=Brassicogethes aeneus TaxID=1431903 RepID=A0A9P0AUG6_BRAAE|nr:unnamed protein product [Brassicogethes aeneus]